MRTTAFMLQGQYIIIAHVGKAGDGQSLTW